MPRIFAVLAITLHTVVIDPGHGGKDPGAVSKDSGTYEKTITLDVARRLADRMRSEYPGLNVILTRDSDVFVPLSDRAAKANGAGADLFISLHVNSTSGTSANGWSVHVMGSSSKNDVLKKNMDICRRENEVVLLEADYSTSYVGFDPKDDQSYIIMSLMQNAYREQSLDFAQGISQCMRKSGLRLSNGVREDPFVVLWKTAMPSVLVEMGFISNSEDLALLRTVKGRQAIADCIFEAFRSYKGRYDASMALSGSTAGAGPEAAAEDKGGVTLYGVQLFTVRADIAEGDPRLLGYRPQTVLLSNGMKKYIVGNTPSEEKARAELEKIRKKYPDAFLVRIENGKVSRL